MAGKQYSYDAVTYSPCQHGSNSVNVLQPFRLADSFDWSFDTTNMPPFNDHNTYQGGDSGSPDLRLTLDGKLVFVGGRSTSPPGPQMQADMDTLSTYLNLPAANYRLSWYPNVVFVGTDTTTKGNWKGTYGADGYNVMQDSWSYPSYASVSPIGNNGWTWDAAPNDVRAPQRGSTGRIAACWYNYLSFDVTVSQTDGQSHRIALYFLDYDTTTRSERIDVEDSASGTILDTRTISGFNGGTYLVWDILGSVRFHITFTGPPSSNAVLSGIFFSPTSQ